MIKRILSRSLNNNFGNLDILFVHIPKTAGTSLKVALDNRRVLKKDYGENSPETSELVNNFIYNLDDHHAFRAAFSSQPFSMVGHVLINLYSDIYDARNIITFLREPVAQVVSHFNHYVSCYNFNGNFESFYRNGAFVNIHNKYLTGFPLSLIGHVGITEYYEQSVMLINDRLNLGLKVLEKNKRTSVHKDVNLLSNQELDEVRRLNIKDVELYNEGVEIHRQRMALCGEGKSWTHIHAQINANNVLHGCAYFSDNDDVVELAVYVNDKEINDQSICAKGFYGLFPKYNFPRSRYIGFRLSLTKWLDNIESIYLIVKKTGQKYEVILPERLKA